MLSVLSFISNSLLPSFSGLSAYQLVNSPVISVPSVHSVSQLIIWSVLSVLSSHQSVSQPVSQSCQSISQSGHQSIQSIRLVTWEEFNWLQEQLQQLNMLHISVAMQTFGHILDTLRHGQVGQGSTSASAQLRYPFEAANTTSVPSTPLQSAENELARLPAGMPPLIVHPRPHKPGLALGFPPCREATPPAEELLVPDLQTSVDTGDEETNSREASASGMQSLLDYLGDSEDESMDVVAAKAKEH
ncbi:hypothetical protein EV363DRAFT_1181987 [Boletus edulis]|nr:hypothetical protein EV363DRAFT_1181987 [Boletus edulis]